MESGKITLLLVSLFHLLNDANVFLLPAVFPLVIQEFSLSFFQTSLLVGCLTFTVTFLQIMIGYLSDFLSRKILLGLGLLIVSSASFLAAYSTNFTILLLSQVLLGIGGSFYHPIGYSLTVKKFLKSSKGKALGVQSSFGDLGILLMLTSTGSLVHFFNWRTPFILWGTLSLISSPLSLFMEEEKNLKIENQKLFSEKVFFSSFLILFFILGGIYRVIYTYIPTYLTFRGLNISLSDLLASLMTVIGLIGSLVSGYFSDKFGCLKILILNFVFTGFFSLFLTWLSNIPLLIILVLVIGWGVYGAYPAAYSLFAEFSNVEIAGFLYGIILSMGMLGGTVNILIAGLIADNFGLNQIFIYTGLTTLLTLPLFKLLKKPVQL